MKIEDLVQLLNNRLREFKLSKNFATMSGDLERANTADIEIISLEDTLFKLNLLIDTSKSAAVKETTLAEVITDGSVAVLGEYNIVPYATDPLHEEKIMNILSKMAVMDTVEKIDHYIKGKYLSSPVTGEMIMSAASAYDVDARLMMAIMEQDSSFGTAGKAVRTLNPGNVGNNDAGDTVTYDSWQDGVTAVARWLSRHRVSEQNTKEPNVVTTPVAAPVETPAQADEPAPVVTEEVVEETTPTTTTTTTTVTTPVAPPTETPEPADEPAPVTAEEVVEETVPTTTTTTTTVTTPVAPPAETPEPAAEPAPVVTEEVVEETVPTTTTTTTTVTTPVAPPVETPPAPVVAEEVVEVTAPTTTTTTTTVTTPIAPPAETPAPVAAEEPAA